MIIRLHYFVICNVSCIFLAKIISLSDQIDKLKCTNCYYHSTNTSEVMTNAVSNSNSLGITGEGWKFDIRIMLYSWASTVVNLLLDNIIRRLVSFDAQDNVIFLTSQFIMTSVIVKCLNNYVRTPGHGVKWYGYNYSNKIILFWLLCLQNCTVRRL